MLTTKQKVNCSKKRTDCINNTASLLKYRCQCGRVQFVCALGQSVVWKADLSSVGTLIVAKHQTDREKERESGRRRDALLVSHALSASSSCYILQFTTLSVLRGLALRRRSANPSAVEGTTRQIVSRAGWNNSY